MSARSVTMQFAPSVGPARAAKGTFPYPHRTLAEIEAEREAVRDRCADTFRATRRDWHGYRLPEKVGNPNHSITHSALASGSPDRASSGSLPFRGGATRPGSMSAAGASHAGTPPGAR